MKKLYAITLFIIGTTLAVLSQPSYYKAWEVPVSGIQLLVDSNGYSYVGEVSGPSFTISKYDPAGNFVWQSNAITVSDAAMKFDRNKDVIVGGTVTVSATDKDFLIAKVSVAGSIFWTTTVDYFNKVDSIADYTIDYNNDIIAIGTTRANGNSNSDIFTAKLNGAGNLLWKTTYSAGAAKINVAKTVSVDQSNNIYVYTGFYTMGDDSLAFIKYKSVGNEVRAMKYYASCLQPNSISYGTKKSFVFGNRIYFTYSKECFEQDLRDGMESLDTALTGRTSVLDVYGVSFKDVRSYDDRGQIVLAADSVYTNTVSGYAFYREYFIVYKNGNWKWLPSGAFRSANFANLLTNGNYAFAYTGNPGKSYLITAIDSAVTNIFWSDEYTGSSFGYAIRAEETDSHNSIFAINYLGIGGNLTLSKYVSSALGISDYSSRSNSLYMYPNPSSGTFVVESNSTEKQLLQLFDITGKLVLNQIIQNERTTVDTGTLPSDVYNVCISSNEQRINRRLVILKK